jgi:hypothetical protein
MFSLHFFSFVLVVGVILAAAALMSQVNIALFFFALATLRSSYGEASPLNLKYSTQEQQGIISAY